MILDRIRSLWWTLTRERRIISPEERWYEVLWIETFLELPPSY